MNFWSEYIIVCSWYILTYSLLHKCFILVYDWNNSLPSIQYFISRNNKITPYFYKSNESPDDDSLLYYLRFTSFMTLDILHKVKKLLKRYNHKSIANNKYISIWFKVLILYFSFFLNYVRILWVSKYNIWHECSKILKMIPFKVYNNLVILS